MDNFVLKREQRTENREEEKYPDSGRWGGEERGGISASAGCGSAWVDRMCQISVRMVYFFCLIEESLVLFSGA